MKIINEISSIKLKFPFNKYCEYILEVMPAQDLIGIAEIRLIEIFSQLKASDNALGCYLKGKNGRNSTIEVNIINLIEHKAPEYLFESYFEIAALILSGVIAHEIGHHAHTFKRHGVKKKSIEEFSDKYSKAGYYNYLKSRSSKILSSYRKASFNLLEFDKKGRKSFSDNRKELIEWLNNSEQPEFP